MINSFLPLQLTRNPENFVAGVNARIALSAVHANRTIIICSERFYKSELRISCEKLFKNTHAKFIVKSWSGEPSLSELDKNLSEIATFKPDLIVAIGGGSIIDGAKILWLLYEHPYCEQEIFTNKISRYKLRSKAKFAAIPTTIGSGSEMSSSAIITEQSTGLKIPVVSHAFIPDLVILDPEFIKHTPSSILLGTIADALTHAIEGKLSKIENPNMDNLALLAIKIISEHWKNALEDTFNYESIIQLQLAASYGGLVQNHCMVGMSHCIAHQLGALGVQHGYANAMLMPHVLEFLKDDELCCRKISELEIILSPYRSLGELLIALKEKLQTPQKFNFDKETVKKIALASTSDPSFRVAAKSFTPDDAAKILEQANI